MENKEFITIKLNGRNYKFEMGVKKELNLYKTIPVIRTEIKSPGRLCQQKYQKFASKLRWPGCKYYRECSDDFLKEKWWSFSCMDCPQKKQK